MANHGQQQQTIANTPMSALENEQHEAFAQARFAGKYPVEAHYAAGFAGDKASSSRLNRLHEVQERIAELFREAAAHTSYEKTNVMRDLGAIIRSRLPTSLTPGC